MKNIAWVFLASLFSAAFSFFTQVFIANKLSIIDFGKFSLLMTCFNFMLPWCLFGIPGVWLKFFGEEGIFAKRWILPGVKVITIISIISFLLFFVFLRKSFDDEVIFLFFTFCSAHIIIEIYLIFFQLSGRYSVYSLAIAAPALFRFIFLIFIFNISYFNISYLSIVFACYSLSAIGVITLILFSNKNILKNNFQLKYNKVIYNANHVNEKIKLKRVIKESWPYAMGAVFHLIYFQFIVIFSASFFGSELAGKIGIGIMLLSVVYIFPSVIYQKVLLPKIHFSYSNNREEFLKIVKQGGVLMLTTGILAFIAFFYSVEYAMSVLFGDKYHDALPLIIAMSFSIPFRFTSTALGSALLVGNNMYWKVRFMGMVAAFSILASYPLSYKYGISGLVSVFILSEILLCSLYLLGVIWEFK